MLRYSAFADDHEIVGYFLDFHEMNEEPKNTQKPAIESLVLGHVTQSESAKAFNLTVVEEG